MLRNQNTHTDPDFEINKEKRSLRRNMREQLGEDRYNRFVRAMVPQKPDITDTVTEGQRFEIREVLNGRAAPAYIHAGTGRVLAGGRVYYDKYKNGTNSMTVLLIEGPTNAAAVAEMLETEMPVKVYFIPYVQWTTSRVYSYYKMKVVFKK